MSERRNAVHGTAVAVAIDADGPLAGALLLGPAGAGKSSLALSVIETCPWRRAALIADDVTMLFIEEGSVWGRPPKTIDGLLEMRGFGPVRCRTAGRCRLVAAFTLEERVARLPEPATFDNGAGVVLPRWPFQAGHDGAVRLRLAMRSILAGQTRPRAHDGGLRQ